MAKLTELKVDDRVWDIQYGYGIVKEINDSELFSITVVFDKISFTGKSIIRTYTYSGCDQSDVRTLFTESNRKYYSERDIELIYTGEPLEDSIIVTAEAYSKWYTMYKIHPNGEVEKYDPYDDGVEYRDDNYNPYGIYELFKDNDEMTIDELTYEVLVGRWVIEIDETY